jgi:uncharacterized surface protein with fasciclin (FAS1) repeats
MIRPLTTQIKIAMKTKYLITTVIASAFFVFGCSSPQDGGSEAMSGSNQSEAPVLTGQSGVQDDESQKNIVQVASGSEDHTTLVAAVQAAELVDVLVNAGPFTVFAPVNAAFDALPAGTVEDLLKPENKETLSDILQYHVAVASLKVDYLIDGQKLEMVNGGYVTISKSDEAVMINDAKIIGTVETSNGIIHVVDKVLLPS